MSAETIWLVGGSSGIGEALARSLAVAGHRVIISGRSQARLQAIVDAVPGTEALPMDVADTGRTATVAEQLLARTRHLDRVIFCAGICEYLDIQRPDWSMMERVMAVNYFGLVNCLRASLELLRRAPRPHLIAVGSQVVGASFVSAEAYGASKAAMAYFLDSLRLDLQSLGIDVTHIKPGFVDTPLTRNNQFPMPFLMSAEAAAQRILPALDTRPRVLAFPRRLSLMLALARWLPGLWLRLNRRQTTASNGAQNNHHYRHEEP